MSGGKGVSASQIRAWLITALCVFFAGNILLAIIRPLIPFKVMGIILISVGALLYRRSTHL
jgi:hypothetical protein